MSAKQNIAEIMQLVKGESSFWMNKNNLSVGKFAWADEYYAVGVGESQFENVRTYIKNQETHHRKLTWEEECDDFFEKYGFVKIKG